MTDLVRNSEKTQISRKSHSAPTQWLLKEHAATGNVLNGRILHHGEGKAGAETDAMGAVGYDPHAARPESRDPSRMKDSYDTAVSNYVFNTLPPEPRRSVRDELYGAVRPGGTAYITVRADKIPGTPHEDGVITRKGTFQKSYDTARALEDFSHPDFDVDIKKPVSGAITVVARKRSK